jgi:hypothetical protein
MNCRTLVALGVICLLPVFACGDDEVTGTNGNGQPSAIQTGQWTATTGSAGFTFTFTVASGASSISAMSMTFSSWRCGNSSAILGGNISSSYTGNTPAISNRAFTLSRDVNHDPMGTDWPITISGSFANSGSEASGTWEGSVAGGTCSGSWTASR